VTFFEKNNYSNTKNQIFWRFVGKKQMPLSSSFGSYGE
jgi:hypothetical protein